MNIKRIIRLCSISGLGTVMALTSCGEKQAPQQAPAPTLEVMTVNNENSELSRSYPATIKGKTDIDIRPLVSGTIMKVHVDEGQHVRKGQTLFTLDQVQFEAEVQRAAAAVAAAQTAVNNASITEKNQRNLLDKNIISQSEWQISKNSLESAKASLAQAQAALTSARKNLSYTVVTSPSDGVVGSIPNREGSLASPSSMQPLTTVSDNSKVYAYFSLTEKDLYDLTKGGTESLDKVIKDMPPVKLRLANGLDYGVEGKVATISGVIDNATGSTSVRALFDNPSGMLHSGNTASLIIPYTVSGKTVVPQKATYEIQNLRYVYVLDDQNMAHSRPIEVFELNDGQNFVVTSGLQPGDRVVIEGVGTSVRDSMIINPKGAEAAQPAQSK